MYQNITIIGYLSADPEMRYTPSGQPVTTFNVPVNRKYTRDDKKVEETTWFRVTTWGNRAEVCNEYLHKGSLVKVEGRLQAAANGHPRVFQKKDGEWDSSFEITANDVLFLSSNAKREENTSYESASQDAGDGENMPY